MTPDIPKFLPDPPPKPRRGGPVTRESQIEARLVKRVKELGGECRKVKWIGRNGAPDRIVMLPMRYQREYEGCIETCIWVELKAPGRKPTAAQFREHERMRKMGQRVEVVDSFERIEEILK